MRNLVKFSIVPLVAAIGFFMTNSRSLAPKAILNLPVMVFRKLSDLQVSFSDGDFYQDDSCTGKGFLTVAHCLVIDWIEMNLSWMVTPRNYWPQFQETIPVYMDKIESDKELHQADSSDTGLIIIVSTNEPGSGVKKLFDELHDVSAELVQDLPLMRAMKFRILLYILKLLSS
ncbi:uncharacterized protein LOC131428656 [Malaya genurostris]|uniref:uncharacterized protein LOC131428656 n=1 Tax=Malaya genurostris TaxID=325434 RepID=UPI0026F39C12|nr:uncharacterized protein LOC131428656 [Malaya genurostris]